MDFSNLLSKKLEQKRQKQQKAKQKIQIPKSELLDGSDIKKPVNESEQVQDAGSSEIDHTKPHHNDENKVLDSIDQEKLAAGLRLFDENEENASKEEQLRKLEIHVKHEKKDLRYKEYLDRENSVEPQIQLEDIGSQNNAKLCLQIRRFFKEIIQTWTSSCDEEFSVSILSETKRDIVKLLYKLRSNKLPADTLVSLSTIVYYIQTENITKANEAYLKLSIGNVAWPIGVRDVGIHARAADAKIAGDDKKQLSNIMKSEATRRWLIAVKRIVNYCEKLHTKQK